MKRGSAPRVAGALPKVLVARRNNSWLTTVMMVNPTMRNLTGIDQR